MQWSWNSLQDKVVGPLVNLPLKALENYLALIAKAFPVHAKITTTDATVTTLATVAIPVSNSHLVRGYVVARRTGGAAGVAEDGAGYRVEFLAKNTAGTAALIGAGTVTVIGESQAAWDVTLAVSGGSVLVKVTGAANNNITWYWTARAISVAS